VLQVLSASIKLSTSGRLPYVHLGPVQQQLLQNSLCAPRRLPNGRADFDFITTLQIAEWVSAINRAISFSEFAINRAPWKK
jgi:hypothetical protein